MDDMFNGFVVSLLSLVFCMAAGYICKKARVLNDTLTSGLSGLLVKVTMPCSIIMSMMRPFTPTLLFESIAAFFLSVAIFMASGLFIYALTRFLKPGVNERKVWLFSLVFCNAGYMGFPVVSAVFGDDAMIYASMVNAAFNLLSFTVGVKIYTGKFTEGDSSKNSLVKLLTTPGIICIFLGLVFFLSGLRLPVPLAKSVQMIGDMTTPISMIIIGSLVAKNKIRALFSDMRVMPVIVLRLLVIPVLSWLVLFWWVENPLLLGVLVIIPSMPVAAVTAIFAEQFKSDSALASKMVVLSTLLSVFTIPLMYLLLTL